MLSVIWCSPSQPLEQSTCIPARIRILPARRSRSSCAAVLLVPLAGPIVAACWLVGVLAGVTAPPAANPPELEPGMGLPKPCTCGGAPNCACCHWVWIVLCCCSPLYCTWGCGALVGGARTIGALLPARQTQPPCEHKLQAQVQVLSWAYYDPAAQMMTRSQQAGTWTCVHDAKVPASLVTM